MYSMGAAAAVAAAPAASADAQPLLALLVRARGRGVRRGRRSSPAARPRRAAARHAVRPRVGARRLRGGCTRCSTPDSRRRCRRRQFAAEYHAAAPTGDADLARGRSSRAQRSSDVIPVRMLGADAVFGTLREMLQVPSSGSGSSASVQLRQHAAVPRAAPGRAAHRQIDARPARASLLAGDGTPLAEGPNRTSPIPGVAGQIVGTLGPIPADEAASYAALGYPANAKVGLNGLERIFQTQLAGTPGGTLLAGQPRARASPDRAPATRSRPRSTRRSSGRRSPRWPAATPGSRRWTRAPAALLALAGVAFSAVQPPGSTMKIITATAALEAGIVKLGTAFPIADRATIDGYTLQNANGEVCGGTLLNAFAVSCNSVFAPLGARVGAQRLVAMAERSASTSPPRSPARPRARSPRPHIGDSLAVGSSAIGQGRSWPARSR